MSFTKGEIRSGAYYDSVILMQLQRSLAGLEGVIDAGVIMGTDANKELLEQISPLFHADKMTAPLYIFQGANDPRVNIREADQMVAALRGAGARAPCADQLASRRPKTTVGSIPGTGVGLRKWSQSFPDGLVPPAW